MVYPVLKINQDSYQIEFVNSQGEHDVSVEVEPIGAPELFYDLLTLFLDQYNCGYDTGYTNAVDDCLEDEEGEKY